MEKKIPVRKRIEAYEYAITRCHDKQPYICWALQDWYQAKYGDRPYAFQLGSIFPELKLMTENEANGFECIWFEPNDSGNNFRETVLLFCIQMALDKTKSPH